jgi:hypothetical protein
LAHTKCPQLTVTYLHFLLGSECAFVLDLITPALHDQKKLPFYEVDIEFSDNVETLNGHETLAGNICHIGVHVG